MKHAYLIMAYGDFYLLKKLIQAIDNPEGDIFLHLDAKNTYSASAIADLRASVRYSTLNIYSNISVSWGGTSQVLCELFLLKKAASHRYGYYHLLSGQDFLLKPVHVIQRYYEAHTGEEFLAIDDSAQSCQDYIDRIDKYHWISKNRRITGLVDNHFALPLQRMLGVHRLKDADLKYFAKGMNWASMTNAFVSCLLGEEKRILHWTRHSICSDEVYKQMVFKMHQKEFKLHKESDDEGRPEGNATMHWADWTRGIPYIFCKDDYDELIGMPYMFARKFSSDVDRHIIDWLYAYVTSNEDGADADKVSTDKASGVS